MEQLFFLLIFGVVAFINWLVNRSRKDEGSAGLPDPRPFKPVQTSDTEAERMRRFFEALGLPEGELPPPKTQSQRPVPAPKSRGPERPPQMVTTVPPLAKQPVELKVQPAKRSPHKRSEKAGEAKVISATSEGPGEFPEAFPETPQPEAQREPAPGRLAARNDIAELLRNPSSVRAAVVLREILGPPRSLQSWN